MRDTLKKLGAKVSAALVALLVGTGLVLAQVPAQPGPPYNVDLGALVTGTRTFNASASTYSQQTNLAWTGVLCTFDQTAASGSASTTFGIQFYDTASNTYQTMVTSGAIASSNAPTSIAVGPGFATTDSSASGYVGINLHLPRFWRLTETNTVSNTTSTRTIGCNLFR